MVQNHMLQLLCLVAMEPPSDLQPDSVRNEKVKVLRCAAPDQPHRRAGRHRARPVHAGRRRAAKVALDELEAERGQPRTPRPSSPSAPISTTGAGPGVPFFLRTGKRLPERRTQIVIQFKPRAALDLRRRGRGDLAPTA